MPSPAPARATVHDVVQHGRRGLAGGVPVPACLEPDAVDGRVYLGLAEDLLDLVGGRGVLRTG